MFPVPFCEAIEVCLPLLVMVCYIVSIISSTTKKENFIMNVTQGTLILPLTFDLC